MGVAGRKAASCDNACLTVREGRRRPTSVGSTDLGSLAAIVPSKRANVIRFDCHTAATGAICLCLVSGAKHVLTGAAARTCTRGPLMALSGLRLSTTSRAKRARVGLRKRGRSVVCGGMCDSTIGIATALSGRRRTAGYDPAFRYALCRCSGASSKFGRRAALATGDSTFMGKAARPFAFRFTGISGRKLCTMRLRHACSTKGISFRLGATKRSAVICFHLRKYSLAVADLRGNYTAFGNR